MENESKEIKESKELNNNERYYTIADIARNNNKLIPLSKSGNLVSSIIKQRTY